MPEQIIMDTNVSREMGGITKTKVGRGMLTTERLIYARPNSGTSLAAGFGLLVPVAKEKDTFDIPLKEIASITWSRPAGKTHDLATIRTKSGEEYRLFFISQPEKWRFYIDQIKNGKYKGPVPGNAVAADIGSVADELAKFKALLDSGAITQAEYDKQKKKLLG